MQAAILPRLASYRGLAFCFCVLHERVTNGNSNRVGIAAAAPVARHGRSALREIVKNRRARFDGGVWWLQATVVHIVGVHACISGGGGRSSA